MIIAEFGSPLDTQQRGGEKVEIYKFVQGYSGGAKAGRALFHGVADVFTLGLWEIASTPIEGMANGTEMVYEVQYDAENKIKELKELKIEGKK